MKRGKRICDTLKEVRIQVAKANGVVSSIRQIAYNWSHLGLVETVATEGQKAIRFRKRKAAV